MARRCGRAALLVSTLAVGVAVAAEEEGSCAAGGSCGEASLAFRSEALGLAVDVRRMRLEGPGPPAERAFAEMAALEAGAIANPDEGRRVGHYWLRSPELAPEDVRQGIVDSWASIDAIAAAAASADLDAILVVGIGGSALGPQLLSDALGPGRGPRLLFLDNTDPDGFDRVLGEVSPVRTWTVIVSKSGSTVETSNGMVEVQARYARAGVDFASRAVAVTCRGSLLDQLAVSEGWRARVPIWDWVGGRTSATSAVGLLPMALQGLDWRAFLAGAAACDGATREEHPSNPAWLLARSWYDAGGGNGSRAMVVLPYKDRLLLLGRYLQQLVMESLGKRTNLAGEVVHQGLTVYGNKGSSDQHAFVQQLRDGPDDFFVCFVNVLEARRGPSVEVAPGATSGDYLLGFLLGTRRALSAAGRRSLTLTLRRLDAFRLGALLALFERAVGLYAALIGINAYHQPGVEAGKRAASEILSLMKRVRAGELLEAAEEPSDDVELIRAHLRANGG